jgi:hypothetical protein
VQVSLTVSVEQTALAHLCVSRVQRFQPLSLFWIRLRGEPQVVVVVMRDFDVPLDGVLWLVVQAYPLVREPNRVVVAKLFRVVASVTKLWDVLLESVLRVAAQVVVDHHVVGVRLRSAVGVEHGFECVLVRLFRLVEFPMLVSVRLHKLEFQCLSEFGHVLPPRVAGCSLEPFRLRCDLL